MTLGTRVPRSLKTRIRVHCAEQDIDIRRFVEEAVRERLGGGRRRRAGR